eukprot:1156931-Pelagomonas_calceolata.AAC.8
MPLLLAFKHAHKSTPYPHPIHTSTCTCMPALTCMCVHPTSQEIEGRRISVVRAVPQDQTRPGTPAAALGAGAGARRDFGRRDYSRYDRGYDRYDRDPLPPRSYGGYDPRYAYDRGYDRYAGYG